MAGPFYNPAAGMGIEAAGASAVVGNVGASTISAADGVRQGLNLATQGVSLYGQYQRSQGRSGGSNKPDPNLARFSEEIDKVQQIRETQGENAARMAERQIGTNFAGAGIAFDQDFQRVYQQKTGKSFNLYGKDEEAAYRDAMLQNESVRNNITASYAVLGRNTTFEERVNWSLNQDAVVKNAARTVDIAQANATLVWNQKVDDKPSAREAYNTVLDHFTAISFGAFERKVSEGQIVTAQDIANSKAQFTQVLASLPRPPGLTGTDGDAQWKVFTDKTDKIKAMYEALENATSSEVLQETMIQQLADAIGKATDINDVKKAATILGAIKGDPLILQGLGGNKFGDVFEALGKVNLDISKDSSSMFAFNLGSTPGLGGPPGSGGTPSPFTIDPKTKALVSGMTPQEAVDSVKGSANYAKIFDPKSMNNRENHEPFRNMASTIAAVLHSDKRENFLSPEFIAANITNPKMMATLKAYAANDPDLGARLMGGYREGLQLEKLRQTLNLQSIEASDLGQYILFDKATNTYKLNEVAFAVDSGGLENLYTEETSRKLGAFNRSIEELYGNSLSEAARDGFKKIFASTSRDPQDIVDIGRLRFLTNAVKRRDAIAALDKGISDLSINQGPGQTMDQAPPPPIAQPAGATSGISSVTEGGAGFTTVTKADGTVVKREGLRSWRNNNPGNLEAGDFATSKGAVGDDGRFAVFRTYEEGREAMRSLLFEGKNYRTKTISEAISRYAPPKENDTALYIKRVTDALGVSDSTKLSDLSNDQRVTMLDAMQKHEGFKEGTETVVEPSSGPGLVSRAGTAIGQALSSPAKAAPLPDSMLPPGFRSTDSQGRPFLRPEADAEVTQGSMLGSLISSVRSALNLGSDEEAQSVAEKLMQSGVIPRRPEGLSVDEPRRPEGLSVDEPVLPPVRGSEQGMAEANQLTPSEQRIANAQARLEERNKSNQGLNKETLSLVESSVPTVNWLRSLGKAVGNLVTGSPAEAAEYKEKVDKAIELANKNPLEFIYKAGDLLGLDEDNPEHQKAIAGMVNGFVKGKVNPFSDIRKDDNAWCAAFVGHVLTNLGFDVPGGSKYNALRARKYAKLGKGVALDEAKAGDLVIIQNPRTNVYHVGFFVDSTSNGIAILGGNQNDEVNITRYPSGRLIKNGIRRINGMEDISPEALKAVQADMSEFAGQSITNMVHRVGDSIFNLRTR